MPLNKRLFSVTGKLIFCSLILLCLDTTWAKADRMAAMGGTNHGLFRYREGIDESKSESAKHFGLPEEINLTLEYDKAERGGWAEKGSERARTMKPFHQLEEGTNALLISKLVQYDLPRKQESKQVFQTSLERIVLSTDSVIYPQVDTSFNLAYKNNSLRFYVATQGFHGNDENRFQFWLEGYDEDWSTWKKEPFKEYTQIPEGTYILHVKGINDRAGISRESLYTFTISPPWYRTGAMYFIYLICAGGAIYALIRWRHSELEAEKAYLEQVVFRFNREVAAKNDELEKLSEELAIQKEKLHELDQLKSRPFEQAS